MADSDSTTGRWIAFDPTIYWNFPHVAAVYVIQVDGVTVYVGQSRDVFKRFNSYAMRLSYGTSTLTPWGEIAGSLRVKISPSKRYGDWAMRELRLIRRLQPVWNCVGSVAPRRFDGRHKGKRKRTTNSVVAAIAEAIRAR